MPWKTFVRQDRRRNVHLRDTAGKPEGATGCRGPPQAVQTADNRQQIT